MPKKVKDVAFLMQCDACKGTKMMRLGRVEFGCIRCNAHGIYIQPTTRQEMRDYLEKKENERS